MKPHKWVDTGIRTFGRFSRKEKRARIECSICNSRLDLLDLDLQISKRNPGHLDEIAKSKRIDPDCDMVIIQSVMNQ